MTGHAERIKDRVLSSPLDFTVYGLHDSWPGLRWLESFSGEPLSVVRLGHVTPDGAQGCLVTTLQRSRHDDRNSAQFEDRLEAVAVEGADRLFNIIWPEPPVPRPAGIGQAVLDHAHEQASRYGDWPRVSWGVDGTSVEAAVWRFAGAWTGFTDALPDSYLVVVAIDVEPEGLRLVRVSEGGAYGVDLTAPVTMAELSNGTGTVLPRPNRHRLHSDLLALTSRE